MKKIIFLSFFLILASLNITAQTYNAPESAVYDAVTNRYFISNAGSGVIIQVNGTTGVKSNFKTGLTGPKGLVIVSGKLFVTDVTSVKGYSVSNGSQLLNLPITGSVFLNDIESNGANYLYVSDMNANAIIRIDITNVASPTYTTFVSTGIQSPNGLIYDAANSRLILVSFRTNSPIQAINTTTAAVSTIITTSLTQLDGITRDDTGNYYVSSWGSNIVYKYNSSFTSSPVAYFSGFNGPADIYYNSTSKVFVVPDMNNNNVIFSNFHHPQIIPSDSVYKCPDETVILQTYKAAGLSYQWKRNGINIGTNSFSFSTSLAGNYTVTTTNIGGYSTSAVLKAINYSVPSKPKITALDTTNFCRGDSVILRADASFNYFWSTKDTLREIVVKKQGKYAVIVFDVNYCSSPVSDSVTVNVYPDISKPQIQVTGSNPFCNGDSVILSGSVGYSYLWSTNETTRSIVSKTKGAFKLQISQYGCKSNWSDSFFTDTLSGASKPYILINGNTQLCTGDSVILSGPPNFKYLWSNNDTTASIVVKDSGIFSLIISKNNCISSSSNDIKVTMNNLPIITMSKLPSTCINSEIIKLNDYLLVNGQYTSLGKWSSANEGLFYDDKINPKDAGVSSPPGWKLKYEYTDPITGCYSKDSTYLNVFPLPTKPIILADPDSLFCVGDSIMLTATSGYPKYLWSINSNNSNSIFVDQADTVNLQITDSNGCSNFANIIVTTKSRPSKPTVIESLSVLRSSVTGKSYLWYKRPPGSSKVLLPLQTLVIDPKPICTNCYYSVIVVDTSGCLSDSSDELLFKFGSINNIGNGFAYIFPNPTNDVLNIRIFEANRFNLRLSINDLNGKLCFTSNITKDYSSINITDLPKGIYFLKISGEDFIFNSKIVKTD